MKKMLKVSSLLTKGYNSCTIEQLETYYQITTFTNDNKRRSFKVENITIDIDFKDVNFTAHNELRFRTYKQDNSKFYINLYTKQ